MAGWVKNNMPRNITPFGRIFIYHTLEILNIKANIDRIEGKTDINIIIVGDINIKLPVIDRTTREINKEIEDLNSIIEQLDLTNIYRTLYPKQQNKHSPQSHREHSSG